MLPPIKMAGPPVYFEENQRISHLLNTELRHIETSKITKLSAIVDKGKAWGKLLEELTKPTTPDHGNHAISLNLSIVPIDLLERQLYCGKSPTLALLNHWSITGRRRPTVKTLLNYLRICNLKWAETFVCQSILGIESIDELLRPNGNQFKFHNLEELVDSLETRCQRYSFKSIYETTNHFCHKPYDPIRQTGTKIGEGRFSSVYRAIARLEAPYKLDSDNKEVVAAKLLKSECNKKYLANEINLIGKVKHPNILELLGIALGESTPGSFNYICLIYRYMQNGSLLDCLSSGLPTRNREFLAWNKRAEIAIKVARGISYLHTFLEVPIIHRDIKTANILIDYDLEPKVGDFTLVRQLDAMNNTDTQFSQNIIGTSVYMPPEAFRGDISTKFDTFSFGIVLLELLTGSRPFNEELDEDLLTIINEKLSDIDDELALERKDGASQRAIIIPSGEARDKFLLEILDKKAGDWHFASSKILFQVALRSTECRKKDRPEISTILPILESLSPNIAPI